MKKFLSPILFFLIFAFCFSARAQLTTSATYSSGIISADGASLANVSINSNCPGLLTVNVPAGRFVTSVDVTYDMQALGINFISSQWSYLECVNTSTKESQFTSGLASVTGTQNYSRTGLIIANGLVAAGGVQFKLHAFKDFGSSCSSSAQRVLNNSWTVTVHHIAAPSCLPPTNIQAGGTTPTSTNLSWTAGGASNWQIEYGPVGFSLGSGILVAASTNPFTLNGLTNSSTYDIYVRDSCGATDVSAWEGPFSLTTSCLPISTPYLEDFESASYVPAIFFNDTGSINPCTNRTTGAYFWTPGPPQFLTTGTGPIGDHTSGSGQYMYSDFGSSSTPPPYQTNFETPFIDLSNLTIPELGFWYHMYGNGIGSLKVEVDNGSGYTNLITYNGEQQNSNADLWKQANINLAAYANDTVRIKFVSSIPASSIRSQVAIDDIAIIEAPSCPKPQNLQSANVTSNSLDLSWTSGGANNWQIEYGPSGFVLGTGTLVNVNSNPFTISSLLANGTYDFYVRDSCGATDVSAWFGPFSENTDCTLFTAPYTENFDASVWVSSNGSDPGAISPCWARNATSGFFWTAGQNATPSFNTGPISDHTSGSGKYIYTEGFSSGNPNITSADIDISPLTSPELRFWYHMFGNRISEIKVLIYDGVSWNVESTIPGPIQTSNSDPWLEAIIDLSSYTGDTIKIRFRGLRTGVGSTSDMAIDDVWLGNSPTCTGPTNINTNSTGLNSISVGWTTGGASNWQVRYRPQGSTGPYTYVQVSSNPYLINGLTPSTTYEISVQDSCGPGDVSFWVGPEFETTGCSIFTAPWFESFDGPEWVSGSGFGNVGNQISPCWQRPAASSEWGTISGPTQTPNTGPSGAFSGANYIYREGSGVFVGSGNITSPSIEVPSSLNSPYLYFHYHLYGNNISNLTVQINGGMGYINVHTISGQQQTSSTSSWIKDSIDLSSYSGDTIKFRLVGVNSGFSGDLAVDEISIQSSGPLCSDPIGLLVSNIKTDSIDLAWTSTNLGSSSIQYYDISIGLPGTIIGNLSSPYTLPGLAPNTTYVINVYDSCSATVQSAFISDTIITMACPVVNANFSFATNLLTTSFTSTSTNADSLVWDFGGISSSDSLNPSFSFTNPGIYNVSLIAYNFCGTSDTVSLAVEVCDSLLPNFTFSNNNDTISFDASNTQGAQSFEWEFGNGSFGNGSQINGYYSSSGNFIVKLKVKNSCGDSAVFSDTIEICLSPIASWNFNIISSGAGGMQVQFDGSASQNAVQYSWDFGDGNSNTTSSQPIHTYAVPSTLYQVTLTVTNSCNETHSSIFRLNEVGITEFYQEDKVDVYPNPSSGKTYVEWNSNTLDPKTLEIYDFSGKLLKRNAITEANAKLGRTQINVLELSDGIYIIRIIGGDIDIKQEFIVRH